MTKDKIGNELKVGDLVYVKLDDPHVFGTIAEITPGSSMLIEGVRGGQREPRVTLGVARLALEQLAVTFHPSNNVIANVVKVVNPSDEAGRGKKPQ